MNQWAKKKSFTTKEAGAICGDISNKTIVKNYRLGNLEGYRVPGGRDLRFTRLNLLRFLLQYEVPTDELFLDAGTDLKKRLLDLLKDYKEGNLDQWTRRLEIESIKKETKGETMICLFQLNDQEKHLSGCFTSTEKDGLKLYELKGV